MASRLIIIPLGDTLTRVVTAIFSKYDNTVNDEVMSWVNEASACATGQLDTLKEDTVESMEEGYVDYEYESDDNLHDMESEYSFDDFS